MKVLKQKNIYFYIVIFLFYRCGSATNIRVAIDVPMSLSKSFSDVEKYVLQGYRSHHIFGINHHIKNVIKTENVMRVKEKKDMISSEFSLHSQKPYQIILCYIDSESDDNNIKKALQETINEYKKSVSGTQLHCKILPDAHFFQINKFNEISIVQKVALNKGFSNIQTLINIMKLSFAKYNLKFLTLGIGSHINIAQIKSDDNQLIELIKNDENILNHLATVRSPKGTEKGFDIKSEIHLYDENKKLATYKLVNN